MDERNVDLNLLRAFDMMLSTGSVTRAGDALGLSQPAMSAVLRRLRALFGDPLFVKVAGRMEPTARALDLAAPVRRVMDAVRDELLSPQTFDPAESDRLFTLVTPDIGEAFIVPPLLQRLKDEAPGVRLRTLARQRSAAAEALGSGEAELAIGYFPDLQKSGFFQQRLFDNRHVCLVRRDHPNVGKGLTLKQYLALSHAVVKPDGREHVFERYLEQRGIRLDVRLEVAHFMSLLPAIENSDLVATVPTDFASLCQRYAAVRSVAAPVNPPPIQVYQFWHRRGHKDPGLVWLRQLIHSSFRSLYHDVA